MFPARAKRVIFLFMNGGPSQVDTFDPKPALDKYNGQRPKAPLCRPTARKGGRTAAVAVLLQQAGRERHRGQRAVPATSARCIDDICVIRSMHTDNAQPRAVAPDDELRRDAADPAEPWLVADLRPRVGEPEPARLRRVLSGPAGGRPAAMEQQLPARRLPGHAHQQLQHRSETTHSAISTTATCRAASSGGSSTCCSR